MKSRRRLLITAYILLALISARESIILLGVARHTPDTGMDFRCYYSAAWTVRSHLSQQLYTEIAQGADPTEDAPAPHSALAQVAHAHGVSDILFYVYPPTLADLLFPFTFLSVSAAFKAWCVFNGIALVVAGIIFVRTPGLKLESAAVPVILFLLLFHPSMDCLKCGQVPILLLLLLVAGMNAYARGNTYTAGLFFTLAAAIKLTPIVILFPLIAMRDWKALRAIALWCVVIVVVLVSINGWGAMELYTLQMLPKLGTKWVDAASRSLNTAFQLVLSRSDGDPSVSGAVLASKIIGAMVLVYAGWLTYARSWERPQSGGRTETLAVFLLLSCCVSPVSWLHAYVLAAPALIIFAKRALEGELTVFEEALFVFFVLELCTYRFLQQVVLTPILGIILGLVALHRLKVTSAPSVASGDLKSDRRALKPAAAGTRISASQS